MSKGKGSGSKKKLLFLTDIDGTLLKGEHGISKNVIAAAKRYTDAGGLLGLATGRALRSVTEIAEQLNVNCASCLLSGSMIYDFISNKVLETVCFDNEIVDILMTLCKSYEKISVQAYTCDDILNLRTTDFLKSKGIKDEINGIVTSPDEINEKILKIVLSCEDIDLLNKCRQDIFCSEKFNFVFSSRHFAEVVPIEANKGNALKKIAGNYGVELSDTFSAGDAHTDLPMLKLSAKSFVPDDAPEEIKKHGDVIPAFDHGGMVKAFEFAVNVLERSH